MISRAKIRFAAYCKNQNKSIEQVFLEHNKVEYSEENFEKVTVNIMRGLQPIEEDEKKCFDLHVTSNDYKTFVDLHDILSLPPPPIVEDIPFAKIAEINYQRFKK